VKRKIAKYERYFNRCLQQKRSKVNPMEYIEI